MLALLALLSLLTLLSTLALARGAEALVEELLLALHHVLHLPHHLAALLIAALLLHVARPRRLQVFQHLLETRQHVAGGVLGPGARQLARPVEHLLQIVAADHPRGIDRRHVLKLLGVHALHVLSKRLKIFVDRLLQLRHQLLDLGIRRVARQRLLQTALNVAQVALRQRQLAVLDAQRRIPQQLLDMPDNRRILVE